jgi:large-conductance mechanosensitive channel
MYTLVEYGALLILTVLVSFILFAISVAFMVIEEIARFAGEGSQRLALRLAQAVKQIPTHNPASQPASTR